MDLINYFIEMDGAEIVVFIINQIIIIMMGVISANVKVVEKELLHRFILS